MIIKPEKIEGKKKQMGNSPGIGFGRKTVAKVCAEYGLDTQTIVDKLKNLGIEASASGTMKEIGEKADMDPHALYEVIRQLQD